MSTNEHGSAKRPAEGDITSAATIGTNKGSILLQEEPKIIENARGDDAASLSPICPGWTRCTDYLHCGIIRFVITLSLFATRRPWTVVIGVSVLSVFIMFAGLATNFTAVHDPKEFLIPDGLPIESANQWIMDSFPDNQDLYISVMLHQRGGNVLNVNTTRKVLEVMEAFWETEGYHEICEQGDNVDIYGQHTCWSYTPGRYWNHNLVYYDAMVKTDLDVQEQVSNWLFPYGQTPVSHDAIMGHYERNSKDDPYRITSAQSFYLSFALPHQVEGVYDLEFDLVETCLRLREEWRRLPNPVYLEFVSDLSFSMEVERAIKMDLPLLPIVFFIMGNFCSIVFWQKHKVKSRWLLGYGAVITIVFSILTGFGILFIVGVPITSMLMFLPFVVFGVGLDDTFIITQSFFRTNNSLPIEERIATTIRDIGLSVTLTTVTTMVAFFLSSLSTIRAVRWLGWYAFLTIFVDALYQVTFYVALLVLDERRIQANRRDICFCIVVPKEAVLEDVGTISPSDEAKQFVDQSAQDTAAGQSKPNSGHRQMGKTLDSSTQQRKARLASTGTFDDESETGRLVAPEESTDCESEQQARRSDNVIRTTTSPEATSENNNFADRLMRWYAEKLVPQRWFHAFVAVVFVGYFVLCCWRTTLLTQEFRTQDFVRDDSYIRDYVDSIVSYRSYNYMTAAYFRNMNQSDPVMHEQMRAYVHDLLDLDHVKSSDSPHPCWIEDFPIFLATHGSQVENLTFTQQVHAALSVPSIKEIYGEDIVFDDVTGEIMASRCWIYLNNLDINDVSDQLAFYEEQRRVTEAQPINHGRKDKAVFSLQGMYFTWEFFSTISRELTFTTISGVLAVSLVGFLLIPHWSAVCFVLPLIIVLYIDVMGTIEMMGLHIDSMVFVCIIVSVGLLVDFLMHMLLRYYETPGKTRMEKVDRTLKTMGSSIFIGGLSTFLGVLPLSLGTSTVMRIVFRCFFAMVTLGVTHGLIFLPVLLAYVGPINQPVVKFFPPAAASDEESVIDASITSPVDSKTATTTIATRIGPGPDNRDEEATSPINLWKVNASTPGDSSMCGTVDVKPLQVERGAGSEPYTFIPPIPQSQEESIFEATSIPPGNLEEENKTNMPRFGTCADCPPDNEEVKQYTLERESAANGSSISAGGEYQTDRSQLGEASTFEASIIPHLNVATASETLEIGAGAVSLPEVEVPEISDEISV